MSLKAKDPGCDTKQTPIRTEAGGFNKASVGCRGPNEEGLRPFIRAMGNAIGIIGLANETNPVTATKDRATSFLPSFIARLWPHVTGGEPDDPHLDSASTAKA